MTKTTIWTLTLCLQKERGDAWVVLFTEGNVLDGVKSSVLFVRAAS